MSRLVGQAGAACPGWRQRAWDVSVQLPRCLNAQYAGDPVAVRPQRRPNREQVNAPRSQRAGPLQGLVLGTGWPSRPQKRGSGWQLLNEAGTRVDVFGFSFLFFFFLAPSRSTRNFPDQGSNLRPQQWKGGVLTTAPPEKSRVDVLHTFYWPLSCQY